LRQLGAGDLLRSRAMSRAPTPITDTEALAETADALRRAGWFALDTEFIRERTYWPRLCLIQVATDDLVAVIDPLRIDRLAPLLEVVFDDDVTKVLHAAAQDLEIFHRLVGRVPAAVVDTQVAAPLLGYPEQAGFARLVESMLGVQLGKGHARTDWSERPLPEAALAYAADDVRYLVPLYHAVHRGLAERGRLEWLDDEMARLTDASRYERAAADAWRRLKGVDRLPDAGRAVAQALAEWREEQARDADMPRGHVLRDDALVDIARALPRTQRQLGRIRSLKPSTLEHHRETVLDLVAEARARRPPQRESDDETRARTALDTQGEALVDALSALVRLAAAEHELNPATLLDRKTLARIAAGAAVADELGGWRYRAVGPRLEAFLAGRIGLRGDDGALVERDAD
jgi:ribonuclease D